MSGTNARAPRSHPHRTWRASALAAAWALLVSAGVVMFPTSASAAEARITESFDDVSKFTSTTAGVTIAPDLRQADDPTLRANYNFGSGAAEFGYTGLDVATLPSNGFERFELDYLGDGTYNTLYLRLRDATGEIFLYWVGNLNQTTWRTSTIDLRNPTQVSGGNGNRVLDAQVSVHRLSIVRNGSQPATGTVAFDDLSFVHSGWTAPVSTTADSNIGGDPTTISFNAGNTTPYELVMTDARGSSRSLTGTPTVGANALEWDGLSNSGVALQGNISARLSAANVIIATPQLVHLAPAGSVSSSFTSLREPTGWVGSSGMTISSEDVQARSAMAMAYNFTAGAAIAGTTPGAGAVPDVPVKSVLIDVRGNGTFSTLYLRARDRSGEVFTYRLGNLLVTAWTTMRADLNSPTSVSGGDGNGRLDWPVSFDQVSLDRAVDQPAQGVFLLDAPRAVAWGWTTPSASTELYTIGSSPMSFSIDAPTAGDYQLALSSRDGSTRNFSGTVQEPQELDVPWDGLSDSGTEMIGATTFAFRHDATPGDGLDSDAAVMTATSGVSVAAMAAPGESLVEGFEGGAGVWKSVLGSMALSTSSDATQSTTSLVVNYNVSAGNSEIGYVGNGPDLPSLAHESLRVDLKGDGTFNTLYLRLRDATGEVLMYRVGTLNKTTWESMTVDLTKPPAHSSGGNGDGRIDAPAQAYRIVVSRNGSQPAAGTLSMDNLRAVATGWTSPSSDKKQIVAGSGQSASLSFTAGGQGDYRLILTDAASRVRTFSGSALAGAKVAVSWDGKDGSGIYMAGIISARLDHDLSPQGSLDSEFASVGTPYLLGVPARASSETSGSLASMNSTLTTYDTVASADAEAALMESAYVRYAREEFEWNRVEPSPGQFDWVKFDRAVAVASARNVEIIGKLVYTADWASSAPSGTPSSDARYYPPSSLGDYVNYVKATVTRYRDTVKVWEVWNEPNIATFWKPAPDPAAYAAMLTATYDAIKEIQPESTVLNGGLAGFSEPFLQQMAPAGAGNSFDGLAIHTYVGGPPESGIMDTWITGAESYLARNAPGRSLWITEAGWTTCNSCTAAAKSTEAQQAQYLSRAMIDAAERGIRAYSWYSLREYGDSDSTLDNFGLVERSGRQKPAFSAFARTASALAGSVSGGSASPSLGNSEVAHDLEATTGIQRASIGAGATSSMAPTSGRIGGAGALSVSYNFTSPTAQGVGLTLNQQLPGSSRAVSIWVYGDASNNGIYLKVTDATGEEFEAKVGNAGVGWSRQVLYFDGLNPNYVTGGGNGDGKLDYPLSVTAIHIFKSGSAKATGQIILDDITAHYGMPVRGSVFYGRNFATQALYAAQSNTAPVPVSNTTAYLYERGAVNALPVANMGASVVVAPLPKFIVSTLLVSPAAGVSGQPIGMNMIMGDRTVLTLQVDTGAGATIRTFATRLPYTSGPRVVTWDGKKSNGEPASAGAYLYRVQIYGPDGRSVAWGRHFTLSSG